jgi:hypothetical protein
MPHPVRFVPALFGLVVLGLMLIGPAVPADNLCRIARHLDWLSNSCLAVPHLAFFSTLLAVAAMALTLVLVLRWRRAQARGMSYESDAGRWVVLGWILVVGGIASLLAGMLLIGSGGWPFSEQSRHIAIKTGQLPLTISTVQRRYFANYSGAAGMQSLCAGFGAVTIRNRSRSRPVALDLGLLIAPRVAGRDAPAAAMPTRDDLAAIVRRGLVPQAMFRNPIELAPRQALRKELVFVIAPAPDGLPDRDYAFALEVKDRLSGQTVSFALPAEYRG